MYSMHAMHAKNAADATTTSIQFLLQSKGSKPLVPTEARGLYCIRSSTLFCTIYYKKKDKMAGTLIGNSIYCSEESR